MRLLIFGTGRVGKSMARYASHLGIETLVATRAMADGDKAPVADMIKSADVVAAAIPDDRLDVWREKFSAEIAGRPAIHFSGALTIPGVRGYHPLYSFPERPLPPDTMAGIAIAREEGAAPFSQILPGARNPEIVLRAEDRAYYHALAVLSGNFAAHIWNEAAKGFAARFGIAPETILSSYLQGVVDRFRESPFDSMTGPVARKDGLSVAANQAAIADEPRLKALYDAFLESAWPMGAAGREKAG